MTQLRCVVLCFDVLQCVLDVGIEIGVLPRRKPMRSERPLRFWDHHNLKSSKIKQCLEHDYWQGADPSTEQHPTRMVNL